MKPRRLFFKKNPTPEKTDILIITLPRRNPHMLYATQLPEALARLKSTVQKAGLSCYVLDFDNPYFKKALPRQDIFYELDEYFRDINDRKFFQASKTKLSPSAKDFYYKYLFECLDKISDIDFKWLGVSVFSEQSARASIDFLELFRQSRPNVQVAIGGYCMTTSALHHSGHVLDSLQKKQKLGEYILNLGLCDYFIVGEGEYSLVELMKGNLPYPGVNNYSPQQIKNLDELPFPDYTDFDFRDYIFPNPNNLPNLLFPMVSITGSRGCVRNCVFCDINSKWPTYRFVAPQVIAHEIIHYYEKYGASNFHWSDSLVNASPPKLHKFLEILTDYCTKSDAQLWQTGSFIVRSPKHMPEKTYALLKRCGFDVMIFGVESGSDKCRRDMKKNLYQ